MVRSFHYPPETASVNLLVKMIAMIRARLEDGMTAEDAMALFQDFKKDYKNAEMSEFVSFRLSLPDN
jgi:hypothetical protein